MRYTTASLCTNDAGVRRSSHKGKRAVEDRRNFIKEFKLSSYAIGILFKITAMAVTWSGNMTFCLDLIVNKGSANIGVEYYHQEQQLEP